MSLSVDGLTTGTGLDIASTATTGGASGNSKLINLSRSGANANASHTAYGLYSDVTNTGTTSTNVALYASASGATTNYAILAEGTNNATVSAFISNSSVNSDADVLALKVGTLTPTTTNYFVAFLTGNSSIAGKIRGNGTQNSVTYDTNGGDFAEYFRKTRNTTNSDGTLIDTNMSPGDLICLDEDGGAVKCSEKENQILGIFSDQAGFVGAGGHENDDNYVLVGLTGQLRVKVSTQSGTLKPRDFLTYSSTPGVAKKATKKGWVVGRALEDSEGKDRVNTLLGVSWYDPNIQFTGSGDLDIALSDTFSVTASNSAHLRGEVPAEAHLGGVSAPRNDISSMLVRLASLEEKVASLTAIQNTRNTQISSESGSLNIRSSDISDLLSRSEFSESATLSGTLTVLGRTLLSNVGITGTVQAGLLSIDGLNANISTLTGPLTLNTLAIDTNGNLFTKGIITTVKIQIDTSDALSASAGIATISAGLTSVQIKTTALTPNSLIFATPDTTPAAVSTQKINTNTFEIRIPEALEEKLKVNWWIVN